MSDAATETRTEATPILDRKKLDVVEESYRSQPDPAWRALLLRLLERWRSELRGAV